jgi:dipeptidyl aminopeptidase/acylaminoacyl peptidase
MGSSASRRLLALSITVLAAYCSAPVHGAVTRERNCFEHDDYDTWLAAVRSQDPGAEELARRVPRESFERYRAGIECRIFEYTVDGLRVQGFDARPASRVSGKLPAIIYNRGGNTHFNRMTLAGMLSGVMPLAARGYFVIGSQYREQDEFGGRDVNDVLALLDIIDSRDDVAADRIGMAGWSRGGIMTISAATRTGRIRAISLVGTPADLGEELRARPDMARVYERYIPDYAVNKTAALVARSPVKLLERLRSSAPMLIMHGGADDRVRPVSALQIAMKLEQLGHPYKLIVYPGADHGIRNTENDSRQQLYDWFDAHLRPDRHSH